MKHLLIATQNPGKFNEIQAMLHGLPFEMIFPGDLSKEFNFEEQWDSFEENAIQKARYFSEKTGMLTLADDSGIIIPALNGEMGVQTRRWGKGENASDEEWIAYFLERMKEFPNQREATFICCIAVAVSNDVPRLFLGKVDGVITEKLEAPIIPGLPLSSCFRPEGFDTVYAALTPEEKGKISHRGKALAQARGYLERL